MWRGGTRLRRDGRNRRNSRVRQLRNICSSPRLHVAPSRAGYGRRLCWHDSRRSCDDTCVSPLHDRRRDRAVMVTAPDARQADTGDNRRPHHARRRAHGRDVRRTRSRHPEEHAARGAEGGRDRGLPALLGVNARGAAREADAVLLEPRDRRKDRLPATPRLAAPCGCATGIGSPIPATPRSCSASRTTRRSRATIRFATRTRRCSRRFAQRHKLPRGEGGDVRQLGRLQPDRRAHRGRHVRQRRRRALPGRRGSRGRAHQPAAGRNARRRGTAPASTRSPSGWR